MIGFGVTQWQTDYYLVQLLRIRVKYNKTIFL